MANKCKCFDCNEIFTSLEDVYTHIEEEHSDRIPKDWSSEQYYYYQRTGKSCGHCVICKNKTTWNPKTNKYNRFCSNPKCKEKYREIFKKRMIGKYNKIHLLNDAQMQRKMLANRKISGIYKWSDGKSEKTYTGSYELSLIKDLDIIYEYDPEDVFCPSPHTYEYEYEGEKHFYIPDIYIASINTEIEVKDGGDNPNKHPKIQAIDKVKEQAKDLTMLKQNSTNYLKITNKDNYLLLVFLNKLKEEYMRAPKGKDQARLVFMPGKDIVKYGAVQESVEPIRGDLYNIKESMDLMSYIDKINGGGSNES